MKPVDQLLLKYSQPKDIILFASIQLRGDRPKQEDFFQNYRDECFVLADGVGGMPHGDVAARIAVESAIWGYKLIRQRHFYWQDKKLFMKRIFRSSNISVYKKQQETGFGDGLATTLVVLMMGTRTFWLGSVGDTSAFLYRNRMFKKLTVDDVDSQGLLTKALGASRYGLVPQYKTEVSLPNDVIVLATDGVTSFVSKNETKNIIEKTNETKQSLSDAADALIEQAKSNGSTDNMTVVLVKRVRLAKER